MLYAKHKERKEKFERKKQEKDQKNLERYSFAPKINKTYK